MRMREPDELLNKPVWSGCGAPIGRVVGWTVDRARGEFALSVLDDGGRLRVVEAEHVERADAEGIHLKGPRQGYHIAPLGR